MKKLFLCSLLIMILFISSINFVAAQTPTADVFLNKTASSTMVLSGSTISYLYNVTNTGGTALNGTIYDNVYGTIGNFVDLQPDGWVGYNVSKVITANTTNVATVYATDSFGRNVTSSDSVFVQVYYLIPIIESCDSSGVRKDTFSPGEDVYVNGTIFGNSTYSMYVVEDVTWSDNMTIPARVLGTATTVTLMPNGTIAPTLAWANPLVPGKYDIVVDVNNNTRYDEGVDALDDNDVEVTAGFFVVPEVAIGSVMAVISMFMALGLYSYKKKHKPSSLKMFAPHN